MSNDDHNKKSEKEKSNAFIYSIKRPWQGNTNSIWLASSIGLQRNIEKFKFPGKLDLERKKQLVSLVGNEILGIGLLQDPKLLKAEDLNFLDREYLVEHFLSMSSFHQMGVGEAFLLDGSGEVLTCFNLFDHLSFWKVTMQGDLENTWSQLVKMEVALGKTFTYSFSAKFGFLTADFSKSGTALTVATYLQVPALLHLETADQLLEQELDEAVMVTGIQGNPTEIIGDILVLQNNYSMGMTEENILAAVRSSTSKLIAEEKNARRQIRESQNPIMMDKVSRAFGVLLHSYQIEAVEALNAISLLKLGVEMDWVGNCDSETLNDLFFNCRRAHLLSNYSEKITQEGIPHKRAEFIHKALKKITLLI